MLQIIAQAFVHGMSIGQIAIAIVVIAGICALVVIALKALDIKIPWFASSALWVLAIVVVIVLAIKLLTSM